MLFWSDVVKYAKHVDIEVTVPIQRKLPRKLDHSHTAYVFNGPVAGVPQTAVFCSNDSVYGQL